MRNQTVVNLGRGRDVRVLEARVCDIRALLELIPDDLTGGAGDALALVRARLPSILAVLSDCLLLPQGETLDNLSLSETEHILSAWWVLHADFFGKALAILGLTIDSAAEPSTTSPKPSPSSAQEESPIPGSGATDTSTARSQ